jgi:hypothetical protein
MRVSVVFALPVSSSTCFPFSLKIAPPLLKLLSSALMATFVVALDTDPFSTPFKLSLSNPHPAVHLIVAAVSTSFFAAHVTSKNALLVPPVQGLAPFASATAARHGCGL